MVEISRNLLSYSAVMPRWFIALLTAGGLLVSVSMLMLENLPAYRQQSAPIVGIPPAKSGRGPASVEPSVPSSQAPEFNLANITNKPVIAFGIAFCSVAAVISALVLLISLPVFLFSSNAERVKRAGGLVKTTLGFFIGSSGAIIATISFAPV